MKRNLSFLLAAAAMLTACEKQFDMQTETVDGTSSPSVYETLAPDNIFFDANVAGTEMKPLGDLLNMDGAAVFDNGKGIVYTQIPFKDNDLNLKQAVMFNGDTELYYLNKFMYNAIINGNTEHDVAVFYTREPVEEGVDMIMMWGEPGVLTCEMTLDGKPILGYGEGVEFLPKVERCCATKAAYFYGGELTPAIYIEDEYERQSDEFPDNDKYTGILNDFNETIGDIQIIGTGGGGSSQVSSFRNRFNFYANVTEKLQNLFKRGFALAKEIKIGKATSENTEPDKISITLHYSKEIVASGINIYVATVNGLLPEYKDSALNNDDGGIDVSIIIYEGQTIIFWFGDESDKYKEFEWEINDEFRGLIPEYDQIKPSDGSTIKFRFPNSGNDGGGSGSDGGDSGNDGGISGNDGGDI